MASTIVIKVKYGETLRRFNARVSEVGKLDLDVTRLTGKVIGLFNFAPDADLTLTYIDEDGDVVTLVDEEDLLDTVRQSLNPLRITVKLNAEKVGRFHARSSGNSTPMRSSPRPLYPLRNLNSSVSGYLTSVPEPFRETFSKMAVDMVSKAASSSSVLGELVDCFSKMGLSQVNSVSEFQTGAESSSQSVALGSTMAASMTSKETEASRDDGLTSYVFPNAKVEEPSSKSDQKVDRANSAAVLGSLSLNAELPSVFPVSEILAPAASHDSVVDEGLLLELLDYRTVEKAVNSRCVDPKTLFSSVPTSDNTKEVKESGKGWNSASKGSFPSTADTMGHPVTDTTANLGGSVDAKVPPMKLAGKCPFPVADRSPHACSFKRSYADDGMGSVLHRGVECDGCGVHPIAGPRFKSIVKENYDLCSTCFSGTGVGTDYIRLDHPAPSRRPHSYKGLYMPQAGAQCSTLPDTIGHPVTDTTANLGGSVDAKVPLMKLARKCPFPVAYRSPQACSFKRSYADDGMGSVLHIGVECDGCGVHPIAGPRFKSIVKENYDLCSTCFSGTGVGTDYIRLDHPAPSRCPHSFKGLYKPQAGAQCSTLPDNTIGFEMKPRELKLDSRFIMDVNVIDGTLVAPSTPFTKVWRLQNSGTIAWPQGTKLVWIGGDKLSASAIIDLQISDDGIPMEHELDISADFTAPELPGQYISYWRMASPSGQKFGQRVWVLIQVDTCLKDSYDSFPGLNLNLPPQESGIANCERVDGNVEAMMVEPLVDAHPYKNQELEFCTNDTLLVGNGGGSGVSDTVPSEARRSVSFPITQIASALPSVTHVSSDSSPITILPKMAQGTSESNDFEQSLLKELEEMGFKQIDLNKEILRLNEYNLEQSLDDLCGIAEWDPILEELQEMGFCDKEMNKKLLLKNNGSIKRVVMDLINGEKA